MCFIIFIWIKSFLLLFVECILECLKLALSEHAPFLPSYAAASAIVIIMETAYMAAVMKSLLKGLGVGVFFFALYTLLYTILQMEKYALLAGTALLLIMLGVFMYVSRNLASKT